jgi:hypothetical protein
MKFNELRVLGAAVHDAFPSVENSVSLEPDRMTGRAGIPLLCTAVQTDAINANNSGFEDPIRPPKTRSYSHKTETKGADRTREVTGFESCIAQWYNVS